MLQNYLIRVTLFDTFTPQSPPFDGAAVRVSYGIVAWGFVNQLRFNSLYVTAASEMPSPHLAQERQWFDKAIA
jgi:hypothetical protein